MAESTVQRRKRSYDIKVELLAKVYAKALFGAAQAAGHLDSVVNDLTEFVREVLDAHPDIEKQIHENLLSNARITDAQRDGLIEKMFGGKVSHVLLNFLKVLLRHQRGWYLAAISDELKKMYDVANRRVPVEVRTALPLEDHKILERITEAVRNNMHKEPEYEMVVDPDLIAGVMVRVGDRVFDGSVATQLKRIKEQLINKSVDEIASRRERLAVQEGN